MKELVAYTTNRFQKLLTARPIVQSVARSIARSIARLLDLSLDRSIARSIARSITRRFLDPSINCTVVPVHYGAEARRMFLCRQGKARPKHCRKISVFQCNRLAKSCIMLDCCINLVCPWPRKPTRIIQFTGDSFCIEIASRMPIRRPFQIAKACETALRAQWP